MFYRYVLYAAFGFFLGGILFSYHIPKLVKGVDVSKDSPDKNPGAANAVKYSGFGVGFACLLCDLAKGYVPVALAARNLEPERIAFAAVMAAPVFGHAAAVFYKFKGGKAIAASFGSLIALIPKSYICVVLAFLYIFFSTFAVINPHEKRSAVVFALTAATALISSAFTHRFSIAVGCTLISATVIYKNLNDPRFSWRKDHREETEEELDVVKDN